MDFETQWHKCLTIIRDNVDEVVYSTWFAPIIPVGFDEQKHELIVQVASNYVIEFIESHYLDLLAMTIHRVFGKGVGLRYRPVVVRTETSTITSEQSGHSVIPQEVPVMRKTIPNPFRQVELEEIDPRLNWNYNFEDFIEGEANRLARSAGISIAANPGKTTFNPLFVYGPSGVGKTHLVHAIGVAAKAKNPSLRVLYVTSNLFQLQYTNAVRQSTINDFINFYQTIDLLIMDDVQEILGKKSTQNTFFNIFNHLHQSGKQIVLTCDRMPAQITEIEDRLLTRFKWGLVAEIERPDLQLRKNILKNKIYADGLDIPDDVVDYIAQHITNNIRDLEGSIVSILARSTFENKPIDIPLAEKVVENLVSIKPLSISLEHIKSVVCSYFQLDVASLSDSSRKKELVQARQIAMFLSKNHTKQSLEAIGRAVGGRNHATVSHACQTISNLMETDRTMRTTVQTIEEMLFKA